MEWLRVAEEWLGNYGWGARGKNLGISRMFSENDMSIIRREKLVASYRPRGILSGFLAVVPSLGYAVYLPPIAAKTSGPIRIRLRLSENLLAHGAVFSCYMTRERKIIIEDVIVMHNESVWHTRTFEERWAIVKEFAAHEWKQDIALQMLQIDFAKYTSIDLLGEPELHQVIEFVPNKPGQKRIIWIPAKEIPLSPSNVIVSEKQDTESAFIVKRDVGPDVYSIWRNGTRLCQALVRTLATSRALRTAVGEEIPVHAEWNKQFEKWEVLSLKQ